MQVSYLQCLALLAPRNVPHLQTRWRLSARCCGFRFLLREMFPTCNLRGGCGPGLWHPDDLNVRAASIVENEEDPAQASGMQRCLQSLQRHTLGASGVAQQMLVSEFSLLEVAFSQHSIDFTEGVAPHRVESILDCLRVPGSVRQSLYTPRGQIAYIQHVV